MAFFAASRMVTIDFKVADIKLESSEGIMKLVKNLSQDFKVISFFVKMRFNNVAISHVFIPTKTYIIFS